MIERDAWLDGHGYSALFEVFRSVDKWLPTLDAWYAAACLPHRGEVFKQYQFRYDYVIHDENHSYLGLFNLARFGKNAVPSMCLSKTPDQTVANQSAS